MDNRFQVVVGAGTMISGSAAAVGFRTGGLPAASRWKPALPAAICFISRQPGCVLNDLYREAAALGIELKGVRVTAAGGFDTATWRSTGIDYSVEVSSDAPAGQLAHLLEVVDEVAEIPQAIRAVASVRRVN